MVGVVVISVAAGSRCETPEVGGIAHFSEHMFFKGSKNTTQSQLEKKVRQTSR
jgi:processing peptidase subunit beta